MRIIAIDPGPSHSAFVVYDIESKGIVNFGIDDNPILCRQLLYFRDIDMYVIEMIASYGMPVGVEVFETCVWIGRFIERVRKYDLLYRKQVKEHLCNSMRAKDSNIRQALIDKLGKPGTKKAPGVTYGISGDVWAALAVAVTWAETRKEKA